MRQRALTGQTPNKALSSVGAIFLIPRIGPDARSRIIQSNRDGYADHRASLGLNSLHFRWRRMGTQEAGAAIIAIIHDRAPAVAAPDQGSSQVVCSLCVERLNFCRVLQRLEQSRCARSRGTKVKDRIRDYNLDS